MGLYTNTDGAFDTSPFIRYTIRTNAHTIIGLMAMEEDEEVFGWLESIHPQSKRVRERESNGLRAECIRFARAL